MGGPGRGARALVVDGDSSSRAVVSAVLRRLDYDPVEAATGLEALEQVALAAPALVVLEVQLEGVSGYEVCRQLQERHGDELMIVFLSGTRVDPIDRVAGLLIGADDYLVKPFDENELSARIRSLGRRQKNGTHRPDRKDDQADLDSLTPREREVVDLLARGHSQGEIAAELFITSKTVATHIQRVLAKLGVHSRAQAVAQAYRIGIVNGDFEGHALAEDADGERLAPPPMVVS